MEPDESPSGSFWRHGGFGLAEPSYACPSWSDLLKHFRVKRLACERGVPNKTEIVPTGLFYKNGTSSRDQRVAGFRRPMASSIFRHKLFRVKAPMAAPQPLAVNLAPGELRPAGIRLGPVHRVFNDALPVFRRDRLPERMRVVMPDHFRHSRRTRRKIDEHGVVKRRRFAASRPRKFGGAMFDFFPVVDGAFR